MSKVSHDLDKITEEKQKNNEMELETSKSIFKTKKRDLNKKLGSHLITSNVLANLSPTSNVTGTGNPVVKTKAHFNLSCLATHLTNIGGLATNLNKQLVQGGQTIQHLNSIDAISLTKSSFFLVLKEFKIGNGLNDVIQKIKTDNSIKEDKYQTS